jgi:GTP-binding nuclear protein Ran
MVLCEFSSTTQIDRAAESLNSSFINGHAICAEKIIASKPLPLPRSSPSDRIFKTERLYVGNLPYDVSSEELAELFGKYGMVKEVHMGRDRKTGLSKGYAFIEYASEDDAMDARDHLQSYDLRGRSLRLDINVKHPAPSPVPDRSRQTPTPTQIQREIPSPLPFFEPLHHDTGLGGIFTPFASFGSSFGTGDIGSGLLGFAAPSFSSPAASSRLQPSPSHSSAWFSNPRESFASSQPPNRTFKILLVGDAKVGKTTWLHRLSSGEFTNEYSATLGASIVPLTLVTTHGLVVLNFSDCAGQRNVEGSHSPHFQKADALILMFSLRSKPSYTSLPERFAATTGVTGSIPSVLVGNQSDWPEAARQVTPSQIIFHRQKNIQYFEISVKDAANLYAPIETLLKSLIDDSGVQILNKIDFDDNAVTSIDEEEH